MHQAPSQHRGRHPHLPRVHVVHLRRIHGHAVLLLVLRRRQHGLLLLDGQHLRAHGTPHQPALQHASNRLLHLEAG